MTTKSVWDIKFSTIDPSETPGQVVTRVYDGQGTVEDVAALVNHSGGVALLRAFKAIAARDGLPHMRRLVTEYGHMEAKFWAKMC
ncbi:hypothetical protein [Streptomyces luteireticuli]|uniref:hypothetical protein n=1 Tax=Streptomyces luteireticuli TaxID=173858 RepID=UPI00355728EC